MSSSSTSPPPPMDDVREKLQHLVKLYLLELTGGSITPESVRRVNGSFQFPDGIAVAAPQENEKQNIVEENGASTEPHEQKQRQLTKEQNFKLAVALAKSAFLATPVFYFPSSKVFPTHNYKLNVLSLDELEKLVGISHHHHGEVKEEKGKTKDAEAAASSPSSPQPSRDLEAAAAAYFKKCLASSSDSLLFAFSKGQGNCAPPRPVEADSGTEFLPLDVDNAPLESKEKKAQEEDDEKPWLQEIDVVPDVKRLFLVSQKADRLNMGMGEALGESLVRLLAVYPKLPAVIPLYNGHHKVRKSRLLARSLSILLVCASSLPNSRAETFCTAMQTVLNDKDERQWIVAQLAPQFSEAALLDIVNATNNLLSMEVLVGQQSSRNLFYSSHVLKLLHEVNYHGSSKGVVPYSKFYNGTAIDFSMEDMKTDFIRFYEAKKITEQRGQTEQQPGSGSDVKFSFASFPFLVDANYKSVMLQFQSIVEQQGAMRNAMLSAVLGGGGMSAQNFFLILNIDRHNLIQSTLHELQIKRAKLKNPLKVQFKNEEGIDEGGVKKEFFQLVTKVLLDPNYGMFEEKSDTRMLWFQPFVKCPHNLNEFYLIGQTLGLAVFNSVILDVNFPPVVYKKLLGIPGDYEDLKEVDPGLCQGLDQLLDFEEEEGMTVEEIFSRNFVYEYDVFGEVQEIPLCPGGSEKSLTIANRKEFVGLIVQHVLEDSIAKNFTEFRNGFFSVCERGLINVMRPEELELLVCGSTTLDFDELERTSRYDGFDKNDETIKDFWSILHSFDEMQKRQFLKFCTGSDRVPIRGLADLNFVIGKNGEDGDQLPTAHTCFNHLLLPVYGSKEKLLEKLLLAITNCQGFGLM